MVFVVMATEAADAHVALPAAADLAADRDAVAAPATDDAGAWAVPWRGMPGDPPMVVGTIALRARVLGDVPRVALVYDGPRRASQ